ncbi:MAG: TspO/MBR family protein [Planctomycetota bacterium]|jgi:tryptophan-rich sensory protein
MRSFATWVVWVVLCFAASLTGIVAPPGDWYAGLEKPPWTPPNWLFGPVWTVLYLMMGTAAWLVWRKGWTRARGALVCFLVQLGLNAAWTPLFFGTHTMVAALVCIALLWLAILATILAFRRHDVRASLLLVPYLLWVTLATALNFELWRLNS